MTARSTRERPERSAAADFDAGYYRRFYASKKTRVQGPSEVARLGAAMVGLVAWYGGPLRSVLDVGAGTGLLRDWFRANHPSVRYLSTEYSPHACARYGHEKRDIARWRARRTFDLVICQGVLPYLSDVDASRAIDNLYAMTRGFLSLEAVTRRDHRDVCDRARTDPRMVFRVAAFYRTRLRRRFTALGGGLYYRRDGRLQFYELEIAG
jgi:hypothetical protein